MLLTLALILFGVAGFIAGYICASYETYERSKLQSKPALTDIIKADSIGDKYRVVELSAYQIDSNGCLWNVDARLEKVENTPS